MTLASDAKREVILDRDLACASCKYNLRGLPVHGKCPECGVLIGATLRIEEERRSIAVLQLTDRRMINDLIAGCLISIVSFAIAVVIAFVPRAAFAYKTQSRSILVGVIVTCWVLSFFGGWKLSAPDRERLYEPRTTARRVLRLSLIAMFIALGLCFLLEPAIHNWIAPFGIIAMLAWFFASGAYYVQLGRLLESLGSSVLTAICFILMLFNVLAMLLGFTQPTDSDTLGTYFTPTLSFGSACYVVETIRALRQPNFEWSVCVCLILYATVLVVHLRLLVLLIRTDEELKQAGMRIRRIRLY